MLFTRYKPSISSSTTREEGKKLSEEVLNKEVTIKQQVVTGKSVPAEEEVHEVCDVEHKSVIDTDIKLYNINSEDLQPISESSEEAQIETTVEPNVPDSPSSAACFDSEGNSVNEKSSKKAIQPIVAGVVGAALLVSSIVAYILKMYAIAVVGGIVGLACVSFALYNIINPNTKLEKVKSVKQPIIQSSLNPT
ncbi:hypothetical protein [Wolbachia endosymbiont (group A) of Icerya purchasi]|uniref:hypothetical protein n=1 Tax=Wolbachia endosymbiont (group A) of Icerya purchasi TaxID=2954019 RepID=UPI00222EAE42|nr:hypothetical protein [Wolbachia endosymbiont (group A) of Icerya purchasi]